MASSMSTKRSTTELHAPFYMFLIFINVEYLVGVNEYSFLFNSFDLKDLIISSVSSISEFVLLNPSNPLRKF